MYQKIQELCRVKQTTINAIEIELGFPRGSIYKWNEHKPSVDKVAKVAAVLGVSIEELLEG